MSDKARQYKPSTRRRLDMLSGAQCAHPTCDRSLLARDKKTIAGKICHIAAASPEGPRYDPKMTDDERRHYDNLLLMCDECHGIVDNKDNEASFPVVMLKEWKKNHEAKVQAQLALSTSHLSLAIDALSRADLDEPTTELPQSYAPFDIQDKIDYNGIKRSLSLIEEYKVFSSKIDALYAELENQGSFKKKKLLQIVQHCYLKAKSSYVGTAKDPMKAIRDNADNIIEDIEERLLSIVEKDYSGAKENMSFGVSLIMVDAFMRCKILENPEGAND